MFSENKNELALGKGTVKIHIFSLINFIIVNEITICQ